MPSLKIARNESELVALLMEGKPESFAHLYDHFSRALFGIVKRIVNDVEIAEDVLQDAFVKIWQKSSNYDSSKGRLFTWMLNIARNTAIDSTRSSYAKAQSKIQKLDNSVGIVNRKVSTTTAVETLDMNDQVNKLQPEQKVIIDMMYFRGYSQDEVSKELNIPLGTVKTRSRSALIKLRETFDIPLR
ncbi:MAG: sigma-70 family RNA polymerase sigma factor [Flavobacteriales bacterium]|nr:sigma-70 family RNA polymerase sigma factor [Flavobacteriales bacterium]